MLKFGRVVFELCVSSDAAVTGLSYRVQVQESAD